MRYFVILLIVSSMLCAVPVSERISSYPYISGDTFRAFADHIIDETGVPFDLESVKQGDIIFVKTDYVPYFFSEIHPYIKDRYILLTHNSDYMVPGNYAHFLNDPKLFAWFGQNIDRMHPKLHAIPIGLANHYWPHGKIEIIKTLQEQAMIIDKTIFLYINYNANTSPERVNKALERLTQMSCAYVPMRKPFAEYAHDLAKAVFVVSPPGNGYDCHRTWESLYLGANPIVKKTSIASLYDDLPVMIVDDWGEITEQQLLRIADEYKMKQFSMNKIYAEYWFTILRNAQTECRK